MVRGQLEHAEDHVKPIRLVAAVMLMLPAAAAAQTANGSPTDPAPRGRIGTLRPLSRTAPTVGAGQAGPTGRSGSRTAVPGLPPQQPAPKETAADRAERLKLERDLRICIGC